MVSKLEQEELFGGRKTILKFTFNQKPHNQYKLFHITRAKSSLYTLERKRAETRKQYSKSFAHVSSDYSPFFQVTLYFKMFNELIFPLLKIVQDVEEERFGVLR